MYEIDVCYKIIFEAMLEKPELKSIAEKINKYTGAKIIFVSGSGKILAYSYACVQDNSESVKWNHVTFSEYEKFRRGEAAGAYQIAESILLYGSGRKNHRNSVLRAGRICGVNILHLGTGIHYRKLYGIIPHRA